VPWTRVVLDAVDVRAEPVEASSEAAFETVARAPAPPTVKSRLVIVEVTEPPVVAPAVPPWPSQEFGVPVEVIVSSFVPATASAATYVNWPFDWL